MLEKDWIKNFPFDYEAKIYHAESIVSLCTIVEQLAEFLKVGRYTAIELFINKANLAEVDILQSDFDGLIRPATYEGAQTVLSNWVYILDSPFGIYDEGIPNLLDQNYFFIREQVLHLINNEVHGDISKFSLDNPTKSDKKLEEKERNTLLIIIAALTGHAKINLDKPSKAAGIISALTEETGSPVSDSTIENIIKKIPDALQKRSK